MPRRAMLISSVLIPTSSLHGKVRDGLRALLARDRNLIEGAERQRVGDSLDLDDASRVEFPNENRWDYLLSVPTISQIIGIEPHSARDAEISVVIAKKQNAVNYLRDHLRPGNRVAKWFWVSHGSVGFSRMDRMRRLLDQNGIAFEGRMLRSFG